MNEVTNDSMEGFSLADLADLDVSDIDEVRYVSIPAGVYDFEMAEADFHEDSKDGEARYKIEFRLKILEVKSVIEAGVNKEDFVGKEHTERFFIKPAEDAEKIQAAIGRVRAFITDIGMDSEGKLGDIVRNTKGHTFTAKIIKQKDRNDKSIEYARLRLEKGMNN